VLAAPRASAAEMVNYVLTPLPDAGRLRVELAWTTESRTQSALYLPAQFATVSDVASLLRDVRFGGAAGAVRKDGSRWLIQHGRGETIRCIYEVDPGRRSSDWDTPHRPIVADKFFHAIGSTFLITPQTGGGLPTSYEVSLRWKLPPDWQAVCSWGSGPAIGSPMSPDDLRNSTYLAGRIVTKTAQKDGQPVTVALVDRFGFRADELAQMAATIVAQQCRFMRETQFPAFLVVAVPVGEPITPGSSRLAGMGLFNSFVLLAAPGSTLTDGFESLFAHELFHYWNGRLLRPASPDKLVYWFVEGFTEYYALRILYESGYWKPATYAKWINRHLRRYQINPARNATNEQILEDYWQQRDTVGEVPYQRGLLLALRWHELARNRGIADGVDRLFFHLIDRARQGGFELTNEAIRQAGVQTLGAWFGPEFDRYVINAETIELTPTLLGEGFRARFERIYDYELGFDPVAAQKEKRVRHLVVGSAAHEAGLREGDQILGGEIQGDPERQITVRIKRDGAPKVIRYFPRGRKINAVQFEPIAP